MCKKCICLIRVSTNAQDLKGQRETVVANAIADGYAKDEIAIVEKKESAIKLLEVERESLNEMKEIISENPSIESVYVFAIDRLARKVSVVLSVVDYLCNKGINLVFINPHKLKTMKYDEKKKMMVRDELTQLLLMFLSYGAEMEMEIKMARFKVAKDVLQAQNKLASGKPMFGYKKLPNNEVVIDDEQAETVRTIFNDYVYNDKSMLQIYKEMIAIFGEKKLGSGQMMIRSILINHGYCGDYSFRDKKKVLKYPRIIDEELFELAQQKIANNKVGLKKQTKNIYYAKSLVRNMDSGYLMSAMRANCAYRCMRNGQTININAVDTIAWRTTCTLIAISNAIESSQKPKEIAETIKNNNESIVALKANLKAKEVERKKAFQMYIKGKITEEIYDEEIAKIEKEISVWNQQISKIESENNYLTMQTKTYKEQTFYSAKEVNDNVTDDAARKQLIDSNIKEIQLTKIGYGKYELRVIPKMELVSGYKKLMMNEYFVYSSNGGSIKLERNYIMNDKVATMDISKQIMKRFENENIRKYRQQSSRRKTK